MVKPFNDEEWGYSSLTGDDPILPLRQLRGFWSLISSGPRCAFCGD